MTSFGVRRFIACAVATGFLISAAVLSSAAAMGTNTSSPPVRHTYLPDRPPLFSKFHYGELDSVNHLASAEQGFQVLSRFELLVIRPPQELSASELGIVRRLRATGRAIYGYVHLATTLSPLTDAQIGAVIDQSADNGYAGVFFDTAGYDYRVSRERFNHHTDHAHGRGLTVMANAWHAEDVLAAEPHELNPSGLPSSMGAGDWILLESFYHRSDDHYAGEFGGIAGAMDDYIHAITMAHARKVKVMGLAYHPPQKSVMETADRMNAYNLALLLGLDGWSYGTSHPDNNLVPWSQPYDYTAGTGYLSELRQTGSGSLFWVRFTDRGQVWFAATDTPVTRSAGITLERFESLRFPRIGGQRAGPALLPERRIGPTPP